MLSRDAARSQILEGSVTDTTDTDLPFMLRQEQPTSLSAQAGPQQRTIPVSLATVTSSGILNQSGQNSLNLNFGDTIETLCQKINWASEELKKSSSVEYSVNLCQLIKSSADALQSLKSVS